MVVGESCCDQVKAIREVSIEYNTTKRTRADVGNTLETTTKDQGSKREGHGEKW